MRAVGMVMLVALALGGASRAAADAEFESVDFPSADGVEVRADLYGKGDAPLIILFHQAGWSRGEYREIGPKLVAEGYRALAVDQRSGRGVNGVDNVTAKRAAKRKLPAGYLDAYPDMVAAVDFAKAKLNAQKVIVWGSSYSASLVIRLAAERPNSVKAVLAFSPGEYFKKGKQTMSVERYASQVEQPLFITSSKTERAQVKPLYDAAPSKKKILFTPASAGRHGSRALWAKWSDSDVYWAAVNGFLETYAPPK